MNDLMLIGFVIYLLIAGVFAKLLDYLWRDEKLDADYTMTVVYATLVWPIVTACFVILCIVELLMWGMNKIKERLG